jgi:transposase
MRRFQREGMAAFHKKPYAGGHVRLTSDQLETVATFVRANPMVSLDELRSHVLAEFGVRYTPAG